jgi:hypothetical protein
VVSKCGCRLLMTTPIYMRADHGRKFRRHRVRSDPKDNHGHGRHLVPKNETFYHQSLSGFCRRGENGATTSDDDR